MIQFYPINLQTIKSYNRNGAALNASPTIFKPQQFNCPLPPKHATYLHKKLRIPECHP